MLWLDPKLHISTRKGTAGEDKEADYTMNQNHVLMYLVTSVNIDYYASM